MSIIYTHCKHTHSQVIYLRASVQVHSSALARPCCAAYRAPVAWIAVAAAAAMGALLALSLSLVPVLVALALRVVGVAVPAVVVAAVEGVELRRMVVALHLPRSLSRLSRSSLSPFPTPAAPAE